MPRSSNTSSDMSEPAHTVTPRTAHHAADVVSRTFSPKEAWSSRGVAPRIRVIAGSLLIAGTLPLGAQDIGERMPALHVTDWIRGSPADVGKWGDGKVYLIELWGTWCAPCKPLFPQLSALQDRYRDRGLVVIGYTWEERASLERFVESMGSEMRYVIVNDSEETLLKALASTGSIQGFPFAFLVDGKGRIAWKGNPKDKAALTSVIDGLISH